MAFQISVCPPGLISLILLIHSETFTGVIGNNSNIVSILLSKITIANLSFEERLLARVLAA